MLRCEVLHIVARAKAALVRRSSQVTVSAGHSWLLALGFVAIAWEIAGVFGVHLYPRDKWQTTNIAAPRIGGQRSKAKPSPNRLVSNANSRVDAHFFAPYN